MGLLTCETTPDGGVYGEALDFSPVRQHWMGEGSGGMGLFICETTLEGGGKGMNGISHLCDNTGSRMEGEG